MEIAPPTSRRHRFCALWLTWLPGVSPWAVVLLFGFVLWQAGGNSLSDDGAEPALGSRAWRLVLLFVVYLATPLWCVLAVPPTLRPSRGWWLPNPVCFSAVL